MNIDSVNSALEAINNRELNSDFSVDLFDVHTDRPKAILKLIVGGEVVFMGEFSPYVGIGKHGSMIFAYMSQDYGNFTMQARGDMIANGPCLPLSYSPPDPVL